MAKYGVTVRCPAGMALTRMALSFSLRCISRARCSLSTQLLDEGAGFRFTVSGRQGARADPKAECRKLRVDPGFRCLLHEQVEGSRTEPHGGLGVLVRFRLKDCRIVIDHYSSLYINAPVEGGCLLDQH